MTESRNYYHTRHSVSCFTYCWIIEKISIRKPGAQRSLGGKTLRWRSETSTKRHTNAKKAKRLCINKGTYERETASYVAQNRITTQSINAFEEAKTVEIAKVEKG